MSNQRRSRHEVREHRSWALAVGCGCRPVLRRRRGTAAVGAIGRAAGTLLRQDVTDDTGLMGYYDVDLRWTGPPDPNASPPSGRLGPAGMVLFMSTLKDQLGLRFTREPGPVQ